MTTSPNVAMRSVLSPNVVTISEALTRLSVVDSAISRRFERSPRAFAFDGSNELPAMAFAAGIEQLERRGVRVFDGMGLARLSESAGPRALGESLENIQKVLSDKTDVVISRSEALLWAKEESAIRVLGIGDNFPRYSSGNISYVYFDRDCFGHPFFSEQERLLRYECFVVTSAVPQTADLERRILQLVEEHFGNSGREQLLTFHGDLVKMLCDTHLSGQPIGELDFVEPHSNLRFLPRVRRRYRDFVDNDGQPLKLKERDPIGFLTDVYKGYIAEGLLYSGHVKRADSYLYSALKNCLRHHREYSTLAELMRANGVLTPIELMTPPENRQRQVRIIKYVNDLLIRHNMTDGMLRGNVSRMRGLKALTPG